MDWNASASSANKVLRILSTNWAILTVHHWFLEFEVLQCIDCSMCWKCIFVFSKEIQLDACEFAKKKRGQKHVLQHKSKPDDIDQFFFSIEIAMSSINFYKLNWMHMNWVIIIKNNEACWLYRIECDVSAHVLQQRIRIESMHILINFNEISLKMKRAEKNTDVQLSAQCKACMCVRIQVNGCWK